MVGGIVSTVNCVVLVAVPPGVVTVMKPVLAVAGTVAVICVSESKDTLVAVTAPNVTVGVVDPLKLVPVIVTEVAGGPLVGVKLVILGSTLKSLALLADIGTPSLSRALVVTLILPVVAPGGTLPVIVVPETTTRSVIPSPLRS